MKKEERGKRQGGGREEWERGREKQIWEEGGGQGKRKWEEERERDREAETKTIS